MSARMLLAHAAALLLALVLPRVVLGQGIGMNSDVMRGAMPGSFVYDGAPSSRFLASWRQRQTQRTDGRVEQVTSIRTDPKTGLELRVEAKRYRQFDAVEWTAYLTNRGHGDSPIVQDLQALDAEFRAPSGADFDLHHNVGSPADGSDYAPLETPLVPGVTRRISAAGGRPTNSDMSYFNLAWQGGGAIVVVGWPGQWAAEFARVDDRDVSVHAGQELTHFRLHPGEGVRTPMMLVLNYTGDWIDGQNKWRRWMMAFGMPKPAGQLPKPMMLASSGREYGEMIGANEANQIDHIDRYLARGLKLDYWWMDAGWYVQQRGWPQVGTWEVDEKRFPHGFRAISDHAHAKGVKILVWFEPERVAPDTWLAEHHPEWLLDPLGSLVARRSSKLGTNEPSVTLNQSDRTLAWNGITWKPRSLSFHPGPKGEYSVVRWRAPESGEYRYDAAFAGIDEKTTTDVHVLAAGLPMFDGFINLNGAGRTAARTGAVHLDAGQSLDLVVGYGNGTYYYDSTGVDATVTGPDGVRHDAAAEFGKKGWSYGFLSPGDRPDAATFQEYDSEAAGSGGDKLLNLGDPDARGWLTDHVDRLLNENGIDLYRQDFNIDPLSFWRWHDDPDHQGITENKYVVGYLAYWDELRRRHPGMLIDSCASGGRRNDLETMRRAVPLWRSDYAYEPIGHQGMTYGISMWLPYHGTGTVATSGAPYYGSGFTPVEPYAFWSNAAPSLGSGIDIKVDTIDWNAVRRLFAAWREVSVYYTGDYYPLTPYSREDDNWIAWQFNRPEKGDGMVQAFRRPKAGDETMRLKLRGLDRRARYRFRVVEGQGSESLTSRTWTGSELEDAGLPVRLSAKPAAFVGAYSRA